MSGLCPRAVVLLSWHLVWPSLFLGLGVTANITFYLDFKILIDFSEVLNQLERFLVGYSCCFLIVIKMQMLTTTSGLNDFVHSNLPHGVLAKGEGAVCKLCPEHLGGKTGCKLNK